MTELTFAEAMKALAEEYGRSDIEVSYGGKGPWRKVSPADSFTPCQLVGAKFRHLPTKSRAQQMAAERHAAEYVIRAVCDHIRKTPGMESFAYSIEREFLEPKYT